MASKVNFTASSVRTISSPSQKDVTTYFVYVNFRDLPENLPLEVNPRKPKTTTAVYKALANAVQSPETDFDINNRGIVIVAKDFSYDTSKKVVTLDLADDPESFGVLDGGHTYTAIIKNRKELSDELDKFVRLEIIVGEDLTVSRIADARNTSASVSDIALFELDDKFDFVKEAIKGQPYENDIAIKDNSGERLPILELLKLLFTYNVYKYKDNKEVPTQAYSSKAAVFKDIKKDLNSGEENYKKLSTILPDLVELYDRIEVEFKDKYLVYNPTGRLGSVRGVEARRDGRKPFLSLFLQTETNHKVATGYILPIFGAFRVLLDAETLSWRVNPFEMWDKIGDELINNTLNSSNNNPQDAGKNANIWKNNYDKVENEMFRMMLAKR